MSFIFDIETLGLESTTVILSAAITHLENDREYTYQELLDSTKFIKFNKKEQIEAGRTITRSTIDWWKEQEEHCKKISYYPNDIDISVIEGLSILREIYKKGETIWSRGSLDQIAIDSLARTFKQEVIAPYWVYRDIRTAIDILKTSSKNGYCDIPDFDKTLVIKHDPIHDCSYDALQLLKGI